MFNFIGFSANVHHQQKPHFHLRDFVPSNPSYSLDFPAALAFFHLALAAAEILALADVLIFRLAFLAGLPDNFFPFSFAQRARCAAATRARPAGLIVLFFFGEAGVVDLVGEPKIWPSFFSNDWIFCLSVAALRNS